MGIYVIVVLGGIVCALGFIPILALVGLGGGAALIGLVLFAVNTAQLYVLVGLIRLRSWAWTWGLVLYGVAALFNVLNGSFVGAIVSLVIVAYLISKATYYG